MKAESAVRWKRLQEDIGPFVYEEDGFSYPFASGYGKIRWAEVDRIVGYKADLLTTDEIYLGIYCKEWYCQFSESTPGWYPFIDRLKLAFPAIPDGWDWDVAMPPFATNFTVLYERNGRGLPAGYNFHGTIERVDIGVVGEAFKNAGWVKGKSLQEDTEVVNSWSEMSLAQTNKRVSIYGRVIFRHENVEMIDLLLNAIGKPYRYGFYGEDKKLLFEFICTERWDMAYFDL